MKEPKPPICCKCRDNIGEIIMTSGKYIFLCENCYEKRALCLVEITNVVGTTDYKEHSDIITNNLKL